MRKSSGRLSVIDMLFDLPNPTTRWASGSLEAETEDMARKARDNKKKRSKRASAEEGTTASRSVILKVAQQLPTDAVPLGTGFYRIGHHIWELRSDDDGYVLVRKQEERAPDLRKKAVASTAQIIVLLPGPAAEQIEKALVDASSEGGFEAEESDEAFESEDVEAGSASEGDGEEVEDGDAEWAEPELEGMYEGFQMAPTWDLESSEFADDSEDEEVADDEDSQEASSGEDDDDDDENYDGHLPALDESFLTLDDIMDRVQDAQGRGLEEETCTHAITLPALAQRGHACPLCGCG